MIGAYRAIARQKLKHRAAGLGDMLSMGISSLSLPPNAKGRIWQRPTTLLRAQDIVGELMSSLNMDVGEIAEGLFKLYEYADYCLVEANIKKDPEWIERGLSVLTGLREAWVEIARKPRGGEDVVSS